jgi:LEA14-like dessication related protein
MNPLATSRRLGALVTPLFLVGALGCERPKAPVLTPQEATVTAVDLAGFDLRVKMDALNPNAFPLAVRAVTARVLLDGKQDLGTVTVAQPITLPPNGHTTIDVPMTVKWKGLAGLASLAGQRRPVPYQIDGTATVGGERLEVDVPFRLQGSITAETLQQAGLKSLQKVPGLEGLPGLLGPR